ncbi:MAG: PilZ domain-containing protein [Gammaproteobacteria bacterium]|nr:PilZ domain-containing protein [Gammaproteobacteria bacterium]MDH5778157.1 PilZ domain-containing protein [Gammaproteobacteria bacterium]
MSNSEQKRHFTRVPFDAEVRVVSKAGEHWNSHMMDVSLKGALIATPENWQGQVGDDFLLELLLAGDDIKIDMEVSVAHVEPNRVGFYCKNIDIDSVTHLHRLIELNLGSEELLEREIAEMLELNG